MPSLSLIFFHPCSAVPVSDKRIQRGQPSDCLSATRSEHCHLCSQTVSSWQQTFRDSRGQSSKRRGCNSEDSRSVTIDECLCCPAFGTESNEQYPHRTFLQHQQAYLVCIRICPEMI